MSKRMRISIGSNLNWIFSRLGQGDVSIAVDDEINFQVLK